ncbi:hypothetical protein A1Q2_02321 [Trichosporon asahii var. asahii CBS 8904]|uniref:Uncharacterized protein n=2 Tax=Trichosporon asahii var. asahii TaxID=189963 RepID=K1W3B7_TRIAC|nr:hypothetical protein A1Q1_00442 [Trichosporon asahii var. asahii CBS 2479]EJT50284.1 hypothetical protein A1Q1_00442 [Trichosporon asahii var. asahii CBS 2479]EKD03383.1 hypothetical protein A1Q2_02321 [Trichosporon asahii var. asahii CBS 8904]
MFVKRASRCVKPDPRVFSIRDPAEWSAGRDARDLSITESVSDGSFNSHPCLLASLGSVQACLMLAPVRPWAFALLGEDSDRAERAACAWPPVHRVLGLSPSRGEIVLALILPSLGVCPLDPLVGHSPLLESAPHKSEIESEAD